MIKWIPETIWAERSFWKYMICNKGWAGASEWVMFCPCVSIPSISDTSYILCHYPVSYMLEHTQNSQPVSQKVIHWIPIYILSILALHASPVIAQYWDIGSIWLGVSGYKVLFYSDFRIKKKRFTIVIWCGWYRLWRIEREDKETSWSCFAQLFNDIHCTSSGFAKMIMPIIGLN